MAIADIAEPAQTAPPGWYADPWLKAIGHERWWDGSEWSRDRARAPRMSIAPEQVVAYAQPGELTAHNDALRASSGSGIQARIAAGFVLAVAVTMTVIAALFL